MNNQLIKDVHPKIKEDMKKKIAKFKHWNNRFFAPTIDDIYKNGNPPPNFWFLDD
jgi:hypothetical protein